MTLDELFIVAKAVNISLDEIIFDNEYIRFQHPTLNGNHVLADKDLVINGLRVLGSVAGVTDVIPGALLRPPGANGKKDILGHGLLEIYLNAGLSTSTRVKGYIDTALATLQAPQAFAAPGFFSVTLTWDGSGDVDLHTFEPGGRQVYYASKTGEAGYLDFDNITGFGPEHYYASCRSDELQTGVYEIALANYRAATGRVATVQVASLIDGVLGTRTTTMGPVTGDVPSVTMFTVVVSKNPDNGAYSVALAQ